MDQEPYNLYSLIVSIITLFVTTGGLIAVYYQIKKAQEVIHSNLHSTLCAQSFELIKLLKEDTDTYDYFYHNKALDDSKHNTTILLIAEAFANFMEQVALQKKSLPRREWKVWYRFIITTLKTSTVVGDFIMDHCEWYSNELVDIVKKWRSEHIVRPTQSPSQTPPPSLWWQKISKFIFNY